ncbi:p-loop NTPase/TK1 [Aratus pisonii nudivirus]|nr:p-loop NTPase/TK1 [Aratus pisonii nudivirus]
MNPTICIDGISCIGKTSTLKHIYSYHKNVVFVDYYEMIKKNPKYKEKATNIFFNSLFEIDVMMKAMNGNVYDTLYMDRSPISSLFYNQIFGILREVQYFDIKNLINKCSKCIKILFGKSYYFTHEQNVVFNACRKFNIIIFNTSNIFKTADRLFKRGTDLDKDIATMHNFKFDYKFCLWYTIVQYQYFKLLSVEISKNVSYNEYIFYYEVENSKELKRRIMETEDDIKDFQMFIYTLDFNNGKPKKVYKK